MSSPDPINPGQYGKNKLNVKNSMVRMYNERSTEPTVKTWSKWNLLLSEMNI